MSNKKILLLTELFPPHSGVGALRMFFFARYLEIFGFTPTVMTCGKIPGIPAFDNDLADMTEGINVYRIDAPVIDSSKHFIAKCLRYPDRFIAPELFGFRWLHFQFKRKLKLVIKDFKPDAVLASAPPEIMLHIGRWIAQKLSVPFIVDIRDIPEMFETSKRIDNRLMYPRLRRRHTQMLNEASAIVSVSDGLIKTLGKRLGDLSFLDKISVVPNGVDLDITDIVPAKNNNERFLIVYTGRAYYNNHEGLYIFFRSLDIAFKRNSIERKITKIIFSGTETSILQPIILLFGFRDVVECVERLSYLDSIALQKRSNIKLHLSHAGHAKTTGIINTKLYEYIACGGPVISVPRNDDEIISLFRKYQNEDFLTTSSPEEIANFLGEKYQNYKKRHTMFAVSDNIFSTNWIIPKEITRKYQTEKLARVIHASLSEDKIRI